MVSGQPFWINLQIAIKPLKNAVNMLIYLRLIHVFKNLRNKNKKSLAREILFKKKTLKFSQLISLKNTWGYNTRSSNEPCSDINAFKNSLFILKLIEKCIIIARFSPQLIRDAPFNCTMHYTAPKGLKNPRELEVWPVDRMISKRWTPSFYDFLPR